MLTPGAPRDGFAYWSRAAHGPLAAAVPVLAAVSTVVGVGTSILGGIQQGAAANAQASAVKSAAEQQQTLARRAANDQRAQAQRVAIEERRRGTLAQSRALAVAGASGAGASDPTVVDLTSNLAGEGEYNALTALYNGESRAVVIENDSTANSWEADVQAASLRAQGRAAKTAGIVGGIGTALKGATSWFADYGSQFFDTGTKADLAPAGTSMYGSSWTNYFD
jgi:hypothetical protein